MLLLLPDEEPIEPIESPMELAVSFTSSTVRFTADFTRLGSPLLRDEVRFGLPAEPPPPPFDAREPEELPLDFDPPRAFEPLRFLELLRAFEPARFLELLFREVLRDLELLLRELDALRDFEPLRALELLFRAFEAPRALEPLLRAFEPPRDLELLLREPDLLDERELDFFEDPERFFDPEREADDFFAPPLREELFLLVAIGFLLMSKASDGEPYL